GDRIQEIAGELQAGRGHPRPTRDVNPSLTVPAAELRPLPAALMPSMPSVTPSIANPAPSATTPAGAVSGVLNITSAVRCALAALRFTKSRTSVATCDTPVC